MFAISSFFVIYTYLYKCFDRALRIFFRVFFWIFFVSFRFCRVSADRIVTGQPEPVPNRFCQPENCPESVSDTLHATSFCSESGPEPSQNLFYQPEIVQNPFRDTQNSAGFCSESGLDSWNQIKVTSISQKLSRISSRTPRMQPGSAQNRVRTSGISSKCRIRVRSGLPQSNPSKRESILEGKNSSIPISSSWSPRV